MERRYFIAILQALLVTFLWSTSFILVKFGLEDLKPLTFSGIRYFMAFLFLLPLALARKDGNVISSKKTWLLLVLIGIAGFTIGQGFITVGLWFLPATATSIILPIVNNGLVILFSAVLLKEHPRRLQLFGILMALIGTYAFYYPPNLTGSESFGVLITALSGLGYAYWMISNRKLLGRNEFGALRLTTITMGFGSIILLLSALVIEGIPQLTSRVILILLWLSLVNTGFAFTLWVHTLKTIKTFESSILNNSMLVQIAILAFIFLGEELSFIQLLAIFLVTLGIFIVQYKGAQVYSGELGKIKA